MTAMRAPVLLSVNVGLPRNVPWQGRTVYTGIWKHPVDGPAMIRRLNIDGDGQGDLNGHGGEQRAVLVYQTHSYRHWQREFGRDDLSPGSFGENFTVDGLADGEVCVGDRYRIGEAEFEVTQPRVTWPHPPDDTAATPPAPPRCCPAAPPTPRTRSNPQPTAGCSFAAPSPAPTSSWTCDKRHDPTSVDGPTTESDEIRRYRAAPAGRGRRQPSHRPAAGDRRSGLERRTNVRYPGPGGN